MEKCTRFLTTILDLHFSPASGAEVDENEDGELVSVLIVEEEEDEEGDKGEGGRGDEANIQEERRESGKGENYVEERGQRRAAVGTNWKGTIK